ncbi:CocE/NonD family hydrolase [Nocardiopsis chromatogenes]|uniref:CocE/NonD family hydrolase n=1 Tax=Nocardiopsis chromatogenes TaxID=280239 RepID=UPI00034A2CD6|nr:CocE/NonD family hydrolase [Nocardiopsis chromatogenes]
MSAVARILRVRVERDLPVPVRGGALRADRYRPASDPRAPLVLMRTPYGRRHTGLLPELLARRGYQVLLLSVRGTADSTGRFQGWHLDPGDAEDTLTWLRTRPWFPGAFATWGASFLGYTQWDLATQSAPEWKAAIIQDAPSGAYESVLYSGGAFALGDWLWWAQSMAALGRPGGESLVGNLLRIPAVTRRLKRAVWRLPLEEADIDAAGERIDYYREWLRHPDGKDAFWRTTDHRADVPNMPPLVHLAGGWKDVFLSGTVADAEALRASGRRVRLLIGPWAHGRGVYSRTYMREAFAFLDHALRGRGPLPPSSTKVHVSGLDAWREYASWPPEGGASRPWYLRPGGGLSPTAPEDTGAAPRAFRYDPADPTPPSGDEAVLQGFARGTVRDPRALEERDDVLVYTSEMLTEALDLRGPVSATLHTRADNPHRDLVVRLYDLPPEGRGHLVTYGILRLDPATDDPARVAMRPAAHRFAPGHRLRVHICGGAFPLWDRNLGTGERGTAMRAVTQQVFTDGDRPSALHLTT